MVGKRNDTWLDYDWQIAGTDARFHVNLSFSGMAPDPMRPVLVYLCFTSKKEGMGLSGLSLLQAETKVKKLVKETDARYVGYIDTNGQRQYYLYAANKDTLALAEEMTFSMKEPACDCGAAEESGWQSYRKLLYPDAAKWQTLENRKLIDRMAKKGDGLTAARRINLHLYFPAEPLQIQFAEEARLSGYAIGKPQFHPEHEYAYGVIVHRISTLAPRALDAVTTAIIRIAEKYEGSLQYLDCPLIPKKHPLR